MKLQQSKSPVETTKAGLSGPGYLLCAWVLHNYIVLISDCVLIMI
jgi:hypothetical protein